MSLDNGYDSGENLEALEQSETEAYVSMGREGKSPAEQLEESNRRLVKADFDYDEEQDCFHCPGGQDLKLKNEDKNGNRVYQGDAAVCAGCQYHARCCQSQKGEARTVNTDCHEGARQRMREHMEQEESKEVYKERKEIVEPVFGQIKTCAELVEVTGDSVASVCAEKIRRRVSFHWCARGII